MNSETFYLVWNPNGGKPTKRHSSHSSAKDEARRLAAQNPGEQFYTLKATSVSSSESVKTKSMGDDNAYEAYTAKMLAQKRSRVWGYYPFVF